MRALYVHIPFCIKKCHYCDFVITVKRKAFDRQNFFAAFEKELGHARQQFGPLHFDTLYLGGGTPSDLSGPEMKRLLELLRREFTFEPGHELTCEVNPGDIDPEKLKAYHALGINRISLGAQSFNDELLRDMGRPHNAADISSTVRMLHAAGFRNISLDLIIKLPRQTLMDVENSLKSALLLEVGQVSVYDLDVHEETVYGLRRREGRLPLPNEDEHLKMICLIEDMLEKEGFAQYELSNFARPGYESRHNLMYWHNQEYLGLGPGAFSYINGVRYQFASEVNRYFAKCQAGDWTNDTEDRLTEEQKEMESLLTGLRLREGFDLERLRLIRGPIECKIAYLKDGGFIKQEDEHIYLTRAGRHMPESVFTELVDTQGHPGYSKPA